MQEMDQPSSFEGAHPFAMCVGSSDSHYYASATDDGRNRNRGNAGGSQHSLETRGGDKFRVNMYCGMSKCVPELKSPSRSVCDVCYGVSFPGAIKCMDHASNHSPKVTLLFLFYFFSFGIIYATEQSYVSKRAFNPWSLSAQIYCGVPALCIAAKMADYSKL